MTNTSQNQRGGAWHDCQLNLEADFALEFTVNFGTTDDDGADADGWEDEDDDDDEDEEDDDLAPPASAADVPDDDDEFGHFS